MRGGYVGAVQGAKWKGNSFHLGFISITCMKLWWPSRERQHLPQFQSSGLKIDCVYIMSSRLVGRLFSMCACMRVCSRVVCVWTGMVGGGDECAKACEWVNPFTPLYLDGGRGAQGVKNAPFPWNHLVLSFLLLFSSPLLSFSSPLPCLLYSLITQLTLQSVSVMTCLTAKNKNTETDHKAHWTRGKEEVTFQCKLLEMEVMDI